MTLRHTLAVILLLTACAAAQSKDKPKPKPTTLFGITIGSPLPAFPACLSGPSDDGRLCNGGVGILTYGQSLGVMIHPQVMDSNVEYVDVIWDQDDLCVQARERLVEKFGKPTLEHQDTAITGVGIEVGQTNAFWTLPDSTAVFVTPWSKVGDCWLLVETPKWQKAHPQKKADF